MRLDNRQDWPAQQRMNALSTSLLSTSLEYESLVKAQTKV